MIDLTAAQIILFADPDTLITLWITAGAAGLIVTVTLRYRLVPADPRPTPQPVRPGLGYDGRHWAANPAIEGRRDWYRAAHTAVVIERGRHHDGYPVRSLVHTSEIPAAELTATLRAGVVGERSPRRLGEDRPIELACDAPGCLEVFRSVDRRNGRYPSLLRAAARLIGWSTRPISGPGARTAPDLCPDHKEAP